MKTFQKTIALSIATLVSGFAFAQLNLGVQSTTQAAVNATANTAAVTQIAGTVVNATKSTVQATATKAANMSAKTTTAVDAKSKQAVKTNNGGKKEPKKKTNVKTSVERTVSSQ